MCRAGSSPQHLLTYSPVLFCSAACSVGAAQACFELARDHVQVRKAFGAPLSANQVPSLSHSLPLSLAPVGSDPCMLQLASVAYVLGPKSQTIQFKLADMATSITASRQMIHLAARKIDSGVIIYLFIYY